MHSNENLPFPVWAGFQFDGRASEYFKIWVVNVLLTIATLGVYSAWAKVRSEAYFYGKTSVNGSSFRYTADPIKILKGRILSILVFALFWILFNFYPGLIVWTLGAALLLFPFVVVASTSFRLQNTMYRNIRFRFDARTIDGYKAMLIPLGLIFGLTAFIYGAFEASEFAMKIEAEGNGEFKREDMIFTILLLSALPLIPYLVFVLRRFVINHMHYGSAAGHFVARARDFYKIYLKFFVFSFGVVIVMSMVLGFVMGALGLTVPNELDSDQSAAIAALSEPIIAAVLVFYAIGFYLLGYLNSRLVNQTYNNTQIGPLQLHSTLRGRDLGNLYLTNTIAVLVSLGLLIPWIKIRMAKYKASRTEFLAKDMAGISAIEQSDTTAIGEELGDIFDLDIGL
jgi:uncharacterized membrane protein YjgN (DUF898 family)